MIYTAVGAVSLYNRPQLSCHEVDQTFCIFTYRDNIAAGGSGAVPTGVECIAR